VLVQGKALCSLGLIIKVCSRQQKLWCAWKRRVAAAQQEQEQEQEQEQQR
jgi:hypothetical protein